MIIFFSIMSIKADFCIIFDFLALKGQHLIVLGLGAHNLMFWYKIIQLRAILSIILQNLTLFCTIFGFLVFGAEILFQVWDNYSYLNNQKKVYLSFNVFLHVTWLYLRFKEEEIILFYKSFRPSSRPKNKVKKKVQYV